MISESSSKNAGHKDPLSTDPSDSSFAAPGNPSQQLPVNAGFTFEGRLDFSNLL
jgi:hypothetical protein